MDSPKQTANPLQFKPIDFPADHELCFHFREDAWLVSYGNLDDYREHETAEWFSFLTNKCRTSSQHYFMEHIWQDQQIIGQLEYQIHPQRTYFGNQGYINLIYLAEGFRNQGLGQQVHDRMIELFKSRGCNLAQLRYIPSNKPAEAFYFKNGWKKSGVPDQRGQLMQLRF